MSVWEPAKEELEGAVMGEFFNLDNKFFQGLNKAVDCVCLSLLWVLCCVPLAIVLYLGLVSKVIVMLIPCIPLAVPAGVASTALYYTVNKVIRHSRGYIWKEFWQAFRSNFKQTGIVTLIVAAVAFVIAIDGYIMLQFAQAGQQGGVLYIVFFVMLIFEAAWAIYLFPYMARFENTTKQVLKNTALMAIGNLPKTLLMLLILALVCLGTYIIPLFIFFIPAVYTLVINFIMEKIFMRYMSEEDIAAEQERNREFYQ